MTDKFLSRKFFLICIVQFLLFICLCTGKLPADVFQSITMTLVSGYLICNSAQNVMTKEKKDETTL